MKKIEDKNIIIISVTNNYLEYYFTFLFSVKKNLKRNSYVIYVIYDNLDKDILAKSLILMKGVNDLIFIKLSQIKERVILKKLIKQSTYWRLLIPYIKEIPNKNVAYVDIDTLILKDLHKLFQISLNSKIIAACVDYLPTIANGVSNWKELGLKPEKPYFNAGMMLINLKKYRESNISQEVIDAILKNQDHLLAYNKWPQNDQYGLNIILIDKWKRIPHMYNYGSGRPFRMPIILHYIGGGKPGGKKCQPKFTKIYHEYLSQMNNFFDQISLRQIQGK